MKLTRYVAALLFAIAHIAAFANGDSLRTQLESLAKEGGIVIEGLPLLADEEAKDVRGDLGTRLEELLRNYNYLLIQNPPGKIAKVVVTSVKRPGQSSAASPYVKTTREGRHHRVDALIVGNGGQFVKVSLLVDTGASTIVLPYSMIQALGFQEDALNNALMRTASGQIRGKIGVLKTVTVGNVSANDVEVGFIPDDQLGNSTLLGMSFLERFRLTFDDAHNEIILLAK